MSFIKKNLWLISSIFGLMIFFSLLMPFFKSNQIIVRFSNGGVELQSGLREVIMSKDVLFVSHYRNLLWPFVFMYVLPLLGIAFSLLSKIKERLSEVSLVLYLVSAILFLSGCAFYDYAKSSIEIGSSFLMHYQDWKSLSDTRSSIGMIWASVFSFLASLSSLSSAYEERRYSLRDLIEIAMLSGIGIVLDFIQHLLPSLSGSSGSIGIATLPLLYLALRHGPLAGFIGGGIVFGLVTCLTDGSGIVFYPFDYLMGFGSVAVLGFFKPLIFSKRAETYNFKGEIFILIGSLLAGSVRFTGSSLSSIVNYGYDLISALSYNVIYVFGSSLLCSIILMALYGPLLRLEKSFPTGKPNN